MAEPNFKLGKIGFILLGVKDLDRSTAFYRDRLGMTVQFQSGEFAFFAAGGITLALTVALAGAYGEGAGANEIVFSVDDVRGSYEALRKQGVQFTHEPHNVTGTQWAANFDDPDGHHLSIFGAEGRA